MPADSYRMPDSGVSKPLKKLFIEKKVLREERSKVLLVANGSEILWIEGFGSSKNAKIKENTKCAYLLESARLPEK